MGHADRRADVVILTAIRLEYEAAREVSTGAVADSQWEEISGPNNLPVAFRVFTDNDGRRPVRIALALSPDMGAVAATNTLIPLVERLRPRCIAMCGVCAGRPGKTNLGDVVAAERLFYHDTGKRLPDGVQQDLTTYKLRDDWKVILEGLSVRDHFGGEAWLQARPLPAEWRANQALHAMVAGAAQPWLDNDPTMDERGWEAVLKKLRDDKLVSKQKLSPTARGRQHLRNILHATKGKMPDLTPTGSYLPFKLHVAPMGAGTQVIEDERVWGFVSQAMRKTLALEMESAAIAELAHRQREHKLDAIVMKGVMDFANHGRDDHFKHFAARASAECLIWFLRNRVSTDRAAGTPINFGLPEGISFADAVEVIGLSLNKNMRLVGFDDEELGSRLPEYQIHCQSVDEALIELGSLARNPPIRKFIVETEGSRLTLRAES